MKDTVWTKTKYSWNMAARRIPVGAELVCENTVKTGDPGEIYGSVLIRHTQTGIYKLVDFGAERSCDQKRAQAFVDSLKGDTDQ